jgi:transcriptional regulator with XRE-family HTH domain
VVIQVDSRVVASGRLMAEAEGEIESLGRRLRARRTELGITLAQLGSMVGLSAGYLSQIERNKTKPSLSALSSIAEALGVELRCFFEQSTPVRQVVRKGRGAEVADRSARVTFEFLSSAGVSGKIEPHRVTCWPAMRTESDTHPGEEFLFVLKGQLEVDVGEDGFSLKAGDSIHYQSSQPHAWQNESGKECVLIWAASPPFLPSRGSGEGG